VQRLQPDADPAADLGLKGKNIHRKGAKGAKKNAKKKSVQNSLLVFALPLRPLRPCGEKVLFKS
jgi:hypothetical protein